MTHVNPYDTSGGQPAPSRAAGYVRVARADSRGALAVAGQEAIRVCAAHGWQVVAVFSDHGQCCTARRGAVAAAHAGQSYVLLVEAQDRLSRPSDETLALLADLGQISVQIHYAGHCAGSAETAAAPSPVRP
jgi:DNA invertase Pin-like site-specific DNA recombinase